MNYAADQVLQIGMELEQRGKVFYEALSEGCGDTSIAALARALAKDEVRHIETFRQMREALPPDRRGPPMSVKQLTAAVDDLRRRIIPSSADVCEVALPGDIGKALEMAIQMEATAVAYYSGLASGAAGSDAAVFAAMAEEEKNHLRKLEEFLTRFRGGA